MMKYFDKKNIAAVIFDMDGIIIDSEPLQKKAFELTLEPYNIHINDDEFSKFIGIRSYENFLYIKEKYNLDVNPERLTQIKNSHFNRLLQSSLEPRSGFMDLLEYVNKRYKLAIASGSIKENVISVVELFNIRNYFSAILTGDDIINGKPHPEIILKTLRHLNEKPDRAVVIEDSENGVKAAKSAGTYVVAVPTSSTIGHNFREADYIFDGLDDVKSIL